MLAVRLILHLIKIMRKNLTHVGHYMIPEVCVVFLTLDDISCPGTRKRSHTFAGRQFTHKGKAIFSPDPQHSSIWRPSLLGWRPSLVDPMPSAPVGKKRLTPSAWPRCHQFGLALQGQDLVQDSTLLLGRPTPRKAQHSKIFSLSLYIYIVIH